MLGKLFKYDFKSIAKPMALFTIIAIATSVLGTLAMRFVSYFFISDNPMVNYLLGGSCIIVVVAAYIAVFAYSVLTLIFVLRRYYTNFFTDEGYLTFTLPTKTNSLLMSKTLAGYIWYLIGTVVTMACLFLMTAIGSAERGEFINRNFVSFFREMFGLVWETGEGIAIFFELIVLVIVAAAYSLLVFYLAITLGSIVAKKLKVLAGIGFFYAINTTIGIIMNIISFAIIVPTVDAQPYYSGFSTAGMGITTLSIYIVLFAGLAVVAYFVNRRLISKKLNLN